MKALVAIVATVLFTLAALHGTWVALGRSPRVAVPSRTDGTPLFLPGRVSTLLVALVLTAAGLLVLARGGVIVDAPGARWTQLGTWVVAALFALRAVGEFQYVGLFKRQRHTPFARWDTRVFTPLCLALATAITVLAAS